jgi:hypothetical protein
LSISFRSTVAARERAVDVVVAALVVARGPEGLLEIDALDLDHRAHGVVEIEVIASGEGTDRIGQLLRSEGSGREDDDALLRNLRDLIPDDLDSRSAFHRLRHPAGEVLPIDGESLPGGNPARERGLEDQRAQPPHFLLEEAVRVLERVRSKGVAADQLGEPIRAMHRRAARGAHLVETHPDLAAGELERGFRPGEPGADDDDPAQTRAGWGSGAASDSRLLR